MKDTQIVILHGWTTKKNVEIAWQPFINLLRLAGFKVTFLFLPGLTQPLDSSWSLDQYVEWVCQQIESKKPCILLGHSFGGQIATRLASAHPDLISRLVLIDSSGIPDDRWFKRVKRLFFLILAKCGKNIPYTKQLKKLLYRFAREQDYYQATDMQKETMRQVIREDLRFDAAKITTSTLLIWGVEDTITPLFMGRKLLSLITHSSLLLIEGARHSPQYTHPKQVADTLLAWIKQIDSERKIEK